MKKKFKMFISLMLAVLIGSACLSGCRLVTVDSKRDMNQIVATIKVNDGEEHIYKKDLVMEYLNYGYMYVQYYGYTAEKTYNLIFDELVSSRILAQGAMKEFEEKNIIADSSKEKYDFERYLDSEKILNAKYNAYVAINGLLESAEEHNHEISQDTNGETVRTTPTDAASTAAKVEKGEKEAYIAKGFDINSTPEKREAFNNVIALLDANQLLGSKYSGTIESTEYFDNSIKNYNEAELLTFLEETLSLEARRALTFEEISTKYDQALEEQQDWSNKSFVDALSNATVGEPMLYSAFGGYGYVHNLLLGVNDEQKAKIEAIRKENPNISDADYDVARKNILASTLVSDFRSSWVNAGYDTKEIGDGENKKLIFTGDYTFAKDEANSLPFQGQYKMIKEADEEKKTPAKYSALSKITYELDAFVSFMDSYLGGTKTDISANYAGIGDSIYSAKALADVVEYKAKINELLFAFSTDDGSLNTYDGYVIKPAVDGANTEEYVKTFGDAGRILLEQGSSYVIVASDFGYHVMFYSEKFSVNYEIANLVDYLNKESGKNLTEAEWKAYYESMIEDWETFEKEDNYLYHIANKFTTNKITNSIERIKRDMINTNRYEESDKVLLYKDVFADLYKA